MSSRSFKRSARVAGEIYEILAEVCVNELSDPRLKGMQLTGAEMTDDLQLVKVFYYVAGAEGVRRECLKGLSSAKGYFRREISSRLKLRLVPDIKFYFDGNIENAEKMDDLLKTLRDKGGMG